MTLEEIRTATSKAQGSRLHLSEALASRELQIATSLEEIAAFEDVQRLIQETAQEVQEGIRFHIQDIVQHALDVKSGGAGDRALCGDGLSLALVFRIEEDGESLKAKDAEILALKEQVASLQRVLAHHRDADSEMGS